MIETLRAAPARGAARLGRLALSAALLSGLAAGVLGTPLAAAAQDDVALPESAALVPDDTLLYLSVNLDIAGDQWAQTQELLTRLGQPNALSDLRAAILQEANLVDGDVPADDPLFGGEITVVISPAAAETAIKLFEQSAGLGMMMGNDPFSALDGQATPATGVASPVAAEEAAPTGIAVIFTPGDADATEETIQELIAADSGEPFETVDYDGVDIDYRAPSTSDVEGLGTALARLDDSILIAPSPADIEPIIDVANGDAPAIAGLDALSQVRGALPEDVLLFAFANGERIGEALPPEAIDALFSATPQYADLGADAFNTMTGFTISADEPGFRIDSVNVIPPGSPLLDLVPDADLDLVSDQRVPAETFFYFAGSDLGPIGALDGLALVAAQAVAQTFGDVAATPAPDDPFATLNPEYVESQFAAAEDILGFDLRSDLFDRFVGEFAVAFSLPGFTAGGLDLNGVIASGLDDETTVAESLTRLARFIDTTVQEQGDTSIDISTRPVDGDRLFVLRDPEALDAFSAEFGVVGEEFLAGIGLGVDDYLNGPADALADDERYQAVFANLPDDPYQIVYLDISQIVTLLETTGVLGDDLGGGTLDADLACADYAGQAEAQEAYDADPFENAALDQDFDGDACEDFFVSATPAASPVAAGSPSAVQALAAVSYQGDEEGVFATSAILIIEERDSDS